MTVFFVTALIFVAVAVTIVLRPLLKASAAAGIDREKMNRDVLRDQFQDIDSDVRAGVLDPAQAAQARQELERRVLEEVKGSGETPAGKPRNWGIPVAIAIVIPVAAIALYLHLGNLQGLGALPHAAANLSSISPEQFQEMTGKLAARLQEQPDDVVGWTMLGRAYRATERHEDAAKAFARASALKPDDADLLADQAESLAISRGRDLGGEPIRLLDRALKLDPDNAKALALAGSAAFERKDYQAAIRYWERLLKQPDIGAELAQALQSGVGEAKALAGGLKPSVPPAVAGRVSGVVSLADALKSKASPEDAVFVFARAAKGPRMPLAIAKVRVKDLPYHFNLDDSMAMMPELRISGFPEIVVGARVSKSGSATPSSGDLEGIGPVIKPGASGVKVSISQVVK
ncbi:MAG TPA: c-type cytochrome biogenesis protein CcmI [Burkholderiales bacterium]